jgi:Icc-related predicted phosphoesterase
LTLDTAGWLMNIAAFADVHGRIRLCFKLCARWERETGEKIDLVLQAGDLGAYPHSAQLDRATIKHARSDPTELGFAEDFTQRREAVAEELERTSFPLIFARGNHEDHDWLDALEAQSDGALFPVDAYGRVFCLKTGIPYTFRKADETITILGIGRIGLLPGEHNVSQPKYIQPSELERLYAADVAACDILLTHDVALDFITPNYGMEEIRLVLDAAKPAYHFHGHTEEPFTRRVDANGTTQAIKLADLHWEKSQSPMRLEAGAMGLLRWHNPIEQRFEVIDADWFFEYNAKNWQNIE